MREIKKLSVFIECSSGSTPTVKTIKRYIDFVSAFGYNRIYLGVTAGYEIPAEPYFNYNRGGYTKAQFQEIDKYAQEHGMELCLNFQTLAHLGFIGRYDKYRDILDTNHTLLVGEEKTYQFVDTMFKTLSEAVSSRTIHIGMDEAWDLGLGQYLQKHGYHEKRELLLQHLNRVMEIARKYGYTCCEIWSDMFFRLVQGSNFEDGNGVVPEDVKALIPHDVKLVHWWYRRLSDEDITRQLRAVQSLSDDIAMAGSAMKQSGLAPYNQYSAEVMNQQIRICRDLGIENYIVTLWSNNGAHSSIFSVLPSVYAASEFVKGKSMDQIDKEAFQDIVGVAYDDFMLLDKLNDPFFKDLKTQNCRCYWGLFNDLLIPSYSEMISEGSNEAYAKLSEIYSKVDGGEFQSIFNNFINMAKVLSIKMNLPSMIRHAYKEKNFDLLKQYAEVEIPKMVQYMKQYLQQYEMYWLQENMAYGLEHHHLFNGGLIARWESTAQRILRYVEQAETIEELENEALPLWHIPPIEEDRCMEMDYRNLISFCGL